MNWNVSHRYKVGLLILTCITGFCIILVNKFAYFPGDIQLAKIIQNILPAQLEWAEWLSRLAEFPWYFILLALVFFLLWLSYSFRGGLFVFISFGGLWIFDKLLRAFMFQPRPSSEIIHVVKALPGSAFPSTAALIYMGTFGLLFFVTLKTYQKSILNQIIFFMSFFVLLAVFLARIALGAHWPSDLMLSYLIGVVWILFLLPFIFKEKV